MDAHDFGRALGFFLIPIAWAVALGLVLWLVRLLAPKAEYWLFTPLTVVIRRLAARDLRVSPTESRPGLAGLVQSPQRPEARD